MSGKTTKKRLAAASLSAFLLTGALIPAGAFAAAQEGSQPAISAESAEVNKTAAAAAHNAANPFRIVAIGDSITVGYELGMNEKTVPYGYADRLYEQALYYSAAEIQNFGILGLKSSGLQNWLAAAENNQSITPDEVQQGITKYPNAAETIGKTQGLHKAIQEADLIAMTIGGNDFLSLFDEMGERTFSSEELTSVLTERLEGYISSLHEALLSIAAINPNAGIVLTDQYLPIPKPSALIKVFSDEQYAVLKAGVTQLSDKVTELVDSLAKEGLDVRVANISNSFAGNELLYTSIMKKDSHPSQAGYEAIGEAFAAAIWGSSRKPAALAADVPLRVVVNGKDVNGTNKPIVKNGTTFLPMRDIAGVLGANLKWDNKSQTATIIAGDKTVAFTIGAKTMKVNGQSVPLETPAYLEKTGKNAATYLPLAALSRGLDYQVIYRSSIKTAFINS
ncbi:stalk domain-containing protein [Paenibacillus sp. GCM10027626]|uniref:stalk domain-containing protein n=1 Tax=Paenibacillus sp. GCM10027626 TaxID=3273411 RepID=UPI00363A32E9